MTTQFKFHPSFGYATPSEIEQLQNMKIGADRDALLNEIRKRKPPKPRKQQR